MSSWKNNVWIFSIRQSFLVKEKKCDKKEGFEKRCDSIEFVNLIKNRLRDLKEEIEQKSGDEIKTKKPDKIVDFVMCILEFIRENQDKD